VALHRSVGLAGIAFGTLLTVVGLLASIALLRAEMAHGLASTGESFLVVPLVNIATFAVFFWLAIANTRRPDYHKRYMLLAAISVLLAPLARPLIVWVLPPAPHTGVSPSIYLSSAWLSYVFIVVAMIYDWRRQGRPHKVYMIALPVLLVVSLLVVPISHSAAWHEFARGFAELAGPLPAKAG
jgi:phosphoglycerol transferase MdoB-like AlkP superfamily enzyme